MKKIFKLITAIAFIVPVAVSATSEASSEAGLLTAATISQVIKAMPATAAARACLAELDTEPARLTGMRERLTIAVRSVAADAVVFAETAPRLPNTVSFA